MSVVAWLARLTSNAGAPGSRNPSPEGASSRLQRYAKVRLKLNDIRPTPVNIFCITMFSIGIINFFAFTAGSLKLHGDALNGKVVDGHYMLGSHGHLHEVSASVFNYSLWHGISVFFITHPLALMCILYLQRDAAKARAGDA